MKIKMKTPIVELKGDEMAQVIWEMIKDKLIKPYVELKVEEYDLGIKNRDKTDDQVTIDAGWAIRKNGVGIKCATITANKAKMEEYGLKEIHRSPNATVREIVDGTIIRRPVVSEFVRPLVTSWINPIVVARHSFGDIYKSKSLTVSEGSKVSLFIEKADGSKEYLPFNDFNGDGVVMVQMNLDDSMRRFADACFRYALDEKLDLIFSTKDTVSKTYDVRFKEIFSELFEAEYKEKYAEAMLTYRYMLIDTAASMIIRCQGNLLWACKNYEGDVLGDMIASGFGSSAMMSSELYGRDNCYEYEASHGTMPDIYKDYVSGKPTYVNPTSLVYAWANGLEKRGNLDHNLELVVYSKALKQAVIATINEGHITPDLKRQFLKEHYEITETEDMISHIQTHLSKILGS
ncbi:MAG: NADP-dependent isocitrate dehydrogenase [Clostridiaceae bacterium]